MTALDNSEGATRRACNKARTRTFTALQGPDTSERPVIEGVHAGAVGAMRDNAARRATRPASAVLGRVTSERGAFCATQYVVWPLRLGNAGALWIASR